MLRKEFPANADGRDWLAKALDRLKESRTGKYDISRLRSVAFGEHARLVDAADWMGPVEVVSVPGKGKGIISREHIPRGTLLIVSKALACSGTNDFDEYEQPADETPEASALRRNKIRLVQTLRRNPQWTRDVYSLYAGDQSPRDEMIPEGIIDMRRIHEIHRFNAFRNDAASEQRTLLHIVPSFINHSCVGPCHISLSHPFAFVIPASARDGPCETARSRDPCPFFTGTGNGTGVPEH
ncbi:TPR domain protein [Aphelenchoides avenae]|nr:TPR domain protein [Aphelenchus avenae]